MKRSSTGCLFVNARRILLLVGALTFALVATTVHAGSRPKSSQLFSAHSDAQKLAGYLDMLLREQLETKTPPPLVASFDDPMYINIGKDSDHNGWTLAGETWRAIGSTILSLRSGRHHTAETVALIRLWKWFGENAAYDLGGYKRTEEGRALARANNLAFLRILHQAANNALDSLSAGGCGVQTMQSGECRIPSLTDEDITRTADGD